MAALILSGAQLFWGCTRKQEDAGMMSRVGVEIPRGGLFSKVTAMATPPPGKSVCYGIHVTGDGIPKVKPSACSPELGIISGFVAEGESLSVFVPRGTNRTFELIVALVNTGAACPTFDLGYASNTANGLNTFVSGSTSGVTLAKDEESVSIQFNFPGTANSVAANIGGACAATPTPTPAGPTPTPTPTPTPPPVLHSVLMSNGDVVDNAGALIAGSSFAANESFYQTLISDPLQTAIASASGMLNFPFASPYALPPQVYSITRKPDSGLFYGIQHDGSIVELTISGGSLIANDISGSCPFAVTSCRIPVWIQSISAGNGTELYGMDHAGQVYLLNASQTLVSSVSPAAAQVSYW